MKIVGGKGFFAGLFLVLLLLNASAASIVPEKDSYLKGEEIVFHGELKPSQAETLVARNGLRTVFEEGFRAKKDGSFSFIYRSDFLDPSGEWVVLLKDNNVGTVVEVKAVPDSAVFVITFSSPIPGEYKRTEDIDISLKVVYLGEEVDYADVAVWDADGKKLSLERKGRGLYGLAYAIPYDASLGDWVFTTVAKKDVNEAVLGGENAIHLSVVPAPIQIDVIEPVVSEIEIEQPMRLVVKPLYFNGKIPKDVTVFGRIGGANISFSPVGDGTFSAEYATTERDAGELVVELLALDGVGNSGRAKVNVVVGGWLSWFVKKYGPYFVAGIAVLLFVLIKFGSKLKRSVGLAKLEQERSAEMAKLKKLQRDYFEVQAIDRNTFEEKSSELESNLARLDERIRAEEGKKKVIK